MYNYLRYWANNIENNLDILYTLLASKNKYEKRKFKLKYKIRIQLKSDRLNKTWTVR